MAAFLVAFGVVFVAELGDKSQLLALAFTARYRPTVVLGGIAVAAAIMLGGAALLGGVLGDRIPRELLGVLAGVAFLGFAVWTVLDPDGPVDPSEDAGAEAGPPARRDGRSALATVVGAFLLAELGDKTMLATATLATQQHPLPTWLGGVAGMVAADGLAVGLGSALVTRIHPRVVQLVAAALFAVVGIALLVDARW